jgi:hypothetical protein
MTNYVYNKNGSTLIEFFKIKDQKCHYLESHGDWKGMKILSICVFTKLLFYIRVCVLVEK